jgi:hypothetical protein
MPALIRAGMQDRIACCIVIHNASCVAARRVPGVSRWGKQRGDGAR